MIQLRPRQIIAHAIALLVVGNNFAEANDASLSFPNPVSPNRVTMSGWDKQGSVKLESDRVFLTSPGEQGQSGAVWSQRSVPYSEWSVELVFRVSGSDRPSGGMALWYTASRDEGPVYGARDYWDGLGIMIDSIGGQGHVRGHLNDGSIGFASLPSPQSQAFNQCQLRYRNTGAMIMLKLTVGPEFLKVEVDGRPCFESHDVQLPPDYFIGVSGASFDNPDSFEIFSLSTTGTSTARSDTAPKVKLDQQPPPRRNSPPQRQSQRPAAVSDSGVQELADQIAALQKLLEMTTQKVVSLREEVESLHSIKPLIERLDQKLGRVESVVGRTEAQFHGATANMHESTKQNIASEITRLTEKLDKIDSLFKEHTTSLVGTLPDTISEAITKGGSSIWFVLLVFILIQGGIVTAYVIYKKRRDGFHPKYL
ncbi:concanavalin A-like lectin/glucanase domain-containing protein [Kockiozyma suomiensis]|uniref:concanavalin A-like lectin/glucanase domain-containing protein n=1 Tax=Kockiozyma suomiensis TaxID=1337062 RepID=UPI003343CC67